MVQHIPASASDQTAAINSTIGAAGAGDTIFFDAGRHVICGTVNMKAGQIYVGPSVTYPLQRQNTRAVLDGCNYTGQFVPASNNMVYGLQLNNFNSYVIAGTSGHHVRNDIFDGGDPNSTHCVPGSGFPCIEWLCNGGDSGTTVDWNTFQNGSGTNNSECAQGGANSTNMLMTHNHFIQCQNDCWGGDDTGATNEVISFNFFERPGQNCGGCGTASAFESSGNPKSMHLLNNFVTGEKSGGPFCISAIGGSREVAFNYCTSPGAAIEWDPHFAQTGAAQSIHDNNMDSGNSGSTIFGSYSPANGSSLANNISSVIKDLNGDGSDHCIFTTAGSCPDYNISFTPFAGTIPSPPSPPAAGAAP